jgi:LacI family transcriptional regulator
VARGRPTVYDVAREAGVSIASVSRYFSHPDALSARTRDRVAGAVTDLGYVQNAAARGLAGGRNETIALCLPDFDAPEEPLDLSESDGTVQVVRGESATAGSPSLFFNQVLSGLEVEARDRGLAVTVVIGRGADPSLDATLERLVGRVDGVVAVAGSLTSPQIQMLSAQVPVVLIADAGAEPNVDHIRSDNVAGMQALVRHLLDEHGVRRPAFLAGPVDSPDSLIRFEAYRGVLEERGMTIPAEPLLVGDFTQPGGRRLGERVLEARERGETMPDALVCANDQTALGVMGALGNAGIRVPQDVIVTGYDGTLLARHSHPSLTTVAQSMPTLGRAALVRLDARMANRVRPGHDLTMPVRLVLGASCGC